MKRLLGTLLMAGLFLSAGFSQIEKPISWKQELSKAEAAIEKGDTLTISFKAEIDKNWYLYSSDFDPDLGPIVTTFEFEENDTYQLVDSIIPINPSKGYDEIWEGEYTYFKKEGEFQQKVIISKTPFYINGNYNYQVCSDIDGKCIPFDEDFSFGNASAVEKKSEVKASKAPLKGEKEKSLLNQPDPTTPYSLLGFMFVAFLGGLAALLTPCVFPMIPMTVTFFTGRAKTRRKAISNAIIYGLSIVVIYVVAGTVVAVINGPEFANWLSTHWLPNVFFFIVFFVFALSFLGLFEINLPSSLVNKMDAKADKGGLGGIFFMAFTLVLVSFSCTGPIVGSILVESAGGQVIKPLVGMFGFSMAFAIPFFLFAIFPDWLKSLPKSGGWLNSVKVILGFLELALGLKFLSVADQVYHWGLLDRDIYLVLWIVIFAFMGLYLLGKIRLPNDSPIEKLSVGRLMLALITFSFVVYMIPGLFGAPLKALAGYLPPMSTHDFNITEIVRESSSGNAISSSEGTLCEEPKYDEFLHFPHGIEGYFDYEQALACAEQQGKPIFVDFTGHGCVNCREMEARVWSEPEVLSRLKNDFVMLALYVDEKKELPESEWYVSEYDGKTKKTIGKQNADFQITRFNNNAQPYYVLLDANGELLVEPIAYETNVQKFVDYLESGKKEFNTQNPN
ncbi:protein-disulfide reductase DsbD family protein [Marivirga atlantica]|uniref:Thioredoxin family protein n=1 Tax=Marivirga atlantica TaxID=1548457 RepID=A0A937AEQ2_9BACT|nr:thioredoxin family protein [Marivirga atlantica]MBL0764244.1 thioredoxin family protein [Marivirga atlantica]